MGILGFAPGAVREAQLAAIREARPPYALIAGGRPSQAAPLQEAGIETFLHVPSPGLLDQFLADGARRFVFEGAECGGHIGPRGSFPLWEAQIQRLLELRRRALRRELRVLFAGGMHDERSAAMVAAMAAPLAQRGAQVGVLMGTAYLFTEEAVRCGAILPGYQRAALDCAAHRAAGNLPWPRRSAAPTRPTSRTFAEAKAQPGRRCAAQQEAWAELEQLNLGRLRIAAKGLRRDGDSLVAVDESHSAADGMYHARPGGHATVAAHHTIAALHAQVTGGAAAFLAARVAELAEPAPRTSRPGDEDPAAGRGDRRDGLRLPRRGRTWPATGPTSWRASTRCTDVPPERWDPRCTPKRRSLGRVPAGSRSTRSAYGIPPSALASIEPAQLLALEVAARALADAGYADRAFDRERASVIFGAEAGSDLSAAYGLRLAAPRLPGTASRSTRRVAARLTEDSFPGVLAT